MYTLKETLENNEEFSTEFLDIGDGINLIN